MRGGIELCLILIDEFILWLNDSSKGISVMDSVVGFVGVDPLGELVNGSSASQQHILISQSLLIQYVDFVTQLFGGI